MMIVQDDFSNSALAESEFEEYIGSWQLLVISVGGRQKAEGRRQKEEGRKI